MTTRRVKLELVEVHEAAELEQLATLLGDDHEAGADDATTVCSPTVRYGRNERSTSSSPIVPGGDVAVLRRYLVDVEFLERSRSGSAYVRVPDSAV